MIVAKSLVAKQSVEHVAARMRQVSREGFVYENLDYAHWQAKERTKKKS